MSRRHEVKNVKGTDCKGLKFAGSSWIPFLRTRIVHAFFHALGIRPDSQRTAIFSIITVRRIIIIIIPFEG